MSILPPSSERGIGFAEENERLFFNKIMPNRCQKLPDHLLLNIAQFTNTADSCLLFGVKSNELLIKKIKEKWLDLRAKISSMSSNLSNLMNSIELEVSKNYKPSPGGPLYQKGFKRLDESSLKGTLYQKCFKRLDELLSDGVKNIECFKSTKIRNIYSPEYIKERFLAIYERDVKTIWSKRLCDICDNDLNNHFDNMPPKNASAYGIDKFLEEYGNIIIFPSIDLGGAFSCPYLLPGLDLTELKLTFLPDSIATLEGIEGLSLSNNQLISLSNSIIKLKKLEMLFLSNNRLISLPDSMGSIESLHDLYVEGNNLICSFPDSFAKFKWSVISCEFNPMYDEINLADMLKFFK